MISGTGVAFTRNPSTGDKKMMGEYLLNAQGEDVVAGIRNTAPIENTQDYMPKVYNQFVDITLKLEKYYKDMQDLDFTIENGKLWVLTTRNGKRTSRASLTIAIDMLDEKIISPKEAISRIPPDTLLNLFVPQIPNNINAKPISRGS